jgi:energy-coupling factor transport system permease protein
MSIPFAYRPLPTPLHAPRASIAAAWAAAIAGAGLAFDDPVVLALLIACVLAAGALAKVGPDLSRAFRAAAIVCVPIVLVNVLVSRQGLTVFARLGSLGPFGQGDLTLEALVYGAIVAGKVTILILVSVLASLTIDPDQLLRGLRRLTFRSALTASLAVRMIPLLAADARRLALAQRARSIGAEHEGGAGRLKTLRSRGALLSATVGSSLERAMDVAATLELRGFARARRMPAARRPLSRHDVSFAGSAIAVAAIALAMRLGSVAAFSAYPHVHGVSAVRASAAGALIAVVALAPFLERRGILR